jgi:3-carboxy-cis,cis-muconate cycloisomerase
MSARLIDGFATTGALASVFSDAEMLDAMLHYEAALANAQARLGIIPASAAKAIGNIHDLDADSLAEQARDSATVAVPFVKALRERVCSIDTNAADFVHYGATSQDVLDTTLIIAMRSARQILTHDHSRLSRRLRALSDQHAGSVMLARTLLQPAPPTTFGYKVAGWFGGVERSWKRLSQSFDEGLQLQFGGASGTLAVYGHRGAELAREIAKELDLAEPDAPWHTHRDRLASIVANCAIYTGSLAKIARDIALLMQPEIAEVSEAGGESSAMPNKRNPAGSVVALAAATRVPGLVAAYLAAMPQEHERAAGGWQSEWPTVAGVIQSTGSALASVADTLDRLAVDPVRMRANIEATKGAVFAEKAMVLLGRSSFASISEAIQGKTLRDGLTHLLTPEQLGKLDQPEDYLGAAEIFRRRLLGDTE